MGSDRAVVLALEDTKLPSGRKENRIGITRRYVDFLSPGCQFPIKSGIPLSYSQDLRLANGHRHAEHGFCVERIGD
jgi:hypothetical protein